MSAPVVNISRGTTPSARSVPTDYSTLFAVGFTERGGRTLGQRAAVEVDTLAAFVSADGQRQSYSPLYDALDAFFGEGGSRAVIARVLGPSATRGTRNLLDAGAAVSLVVTAKGEGSYSSGVTAQVVNNGTTYNLIFVDTSTGGITEAPAAFSTLQAAVDWSTTSQLVDIALGASSNLPATLAASALSAGTDDHLNAVDSNWATSLALYAQDLGPGQVAMPGRTTSAAHAQLEAHADANGRVALLDYPDTFTSSTLTSLAATDRAAPGQRAAGVFAPWVQIPGLASSPLSLRIVPPSGVVAGVMARNDSAGKSPNVASAGELGELQYAVGLSQAAWDKPTRDTLSDAGINVIRTLFGAPRIFGYRTLADPNADPNWKFLSNARLFSAIWADGYAIGQEFAFAQIDGNGHKIGEFQGALVGMLLEWYKLGSLYGTSPDQAFSVDVSANNPTTESNGQLLATMNVRMSPMAEDVEEIIVKVPITSALP